MKMKRNKTLSAVMAVILSMSIVVGCTIAYMTYYSGEMHNKFTIMLDVSSKIVEKFDPDPVIDGSTVSVEKSVQVINTSTIGEYVRVMVAFEDSEIESKAYFSVDGETYYSLSEFQSSLSSLSEDNPTYKTDDDGNGYAWIYNNDDGYYYYTKILEPGDYESILDGSAYYDEDSGQYYYYTDSSLISDSIITDPLFTYVKIVFDEEADIQSFGIYIYSESCPYYLGNDYSQAWTNYLTAYKEG